MKNLQHNEISEWLQYHCNVKKNTTPKSLYTETERDRLKAIQKTDI